MAIQFIDPGGEYYFSAGVNAVGVWTAGTAGVTLTSSAAAGRNSNYALTNSLNSTAVAIRNLGTSFQSLIAGGAFYIVGSYGNNAPLIRFNDVGTNQCDVRINLTGNLFFTRNGTQVGGSSTNSIAVSSGWQYVECKCFIAGGTSGSMEVKVNGVVWLTVTGQNFQNTGNASANQVTFQTPGSSGTGWAMKDMYILDTGTGLNTGYMGDISVSVQYPTGAGVNNQWTPLSGTQANEYKMVWDSPVNTASWPDGDSSYIYSVTPGQLADFAHQSLTSIGQISVVVHAQYSRKDDAGTRQVAPICISGATTEQGTTISLSNNFSYYYDVLEVDPNAPNSLISIAITDQLNYWNDIVTGTYGATNINSGQSGAGAGGPGTAVVSVNGQWTLGGYNAATFGIKEIS